MGAEYHKDPVDLYKKKRYELMAHVVLRRYKSYLDAAKVNESLRLRDILWLIGFDKACYENECEKAKNNGQIENGNVPVFEFLIGEIVKFKENSDLSVKDGIQRGEDSFNNFLKIKERDIEYTKFDEFKEERINFPLICTIQEMLAVNCPRPSGVLKLFEDSDIKSLTKDFSKTSP